MKSVMISIRPEWCRKILNGEKTLELRKSAPRITPPFKCHIYCTQGREILSYEQYCGYDITDFTEDFVANKKVIAEFVCDKIIPVRVFGNGSIKDWNANRLESSCLSYDAIAMYIGTNRCGYAWHVSNLKVYEKPIDISEFYGGCDKGVLFDCSFCREHNVCVSCKPLTSAPQSWCYVETKEESE